MRRLYEELESTPKEEAKELFTGPGFVASNDTLMSVKSPHIAVGARKNSVELLSLSYVGVRGWGEA